MFRRVVLALLLLAPVLVTACPQYLDGEPPRITNPRLATETRALCFAGFAVVHSGVTRTPLWSAEHLTADRLDEARDVPRKDRFHAERRLPKRERAELDDYSRSGYDRGHLAPAADMHSHQAQYDSFSLANIVPQNPENNRNLWEGIESAVRSLTRRRGELYVISGALFEGDELKRIGGRVLVPSHLYKAVYDPGRREAAAYLVSNTATDDYQTLSLAALEARAGVELFPTLPAEVKASAMSLPVPVPYNQRHRRR